MSKLVVSVMSAFENIIAPVVEYSSYDSAPIAPVSYSLAEEVHLLVHEHHFAQAYQRLALGRLQLNASLRNPQSEVDLCPVSVGGAQQRPAEGQGLALDFSRACP